MAARNQRDNVTESEDESFDGDHEAQYQLQSVHRTRRGNSVSHQSRPPALRNADSDFKLMLQSEFGKLPIDMKDLLESKRVLDKMPQSKYEEEEFQLFSKGMKRDELPSVVEMLEATFSSFLKGEKEEKKFKVKAKSLLLSGEITKPRFKHQGFHDGVGMYIDGYTVVRNHDAETCDVFCALFGMTVEFGKHRKITLPDSQEQKGDGRWKFLSRTSWAYEPKKTLDTGEINHLMDNYLRNKSLRYFKDQGLIQEVPLTGEQHLTEEEKLELRPVTGAVAPAPLAAIRMKKSDSNA